MLPLALDCSTDTLHWCLWLEPQEFAVTARHLLGSQDGYLILAEDPIVGGHVSTNITSYQFSAVRTTQMIKP